MGEFKDSLIIEMVTKKTGQISPEGLVGYALGLRDMYDKIAPRVPENKELTEALKAISKVTEDAELPLLKAVHQIAFKTLKAVK